MCFNIVSKNGSYVFFKLVLIVYIQVDLSLFEAFLSEISNKGIFWEMRFLMKMQNFSCNS